MNETILIIEDEDNLARFIELELIHEGYRVEKARTGRQGLSMFEAGNFDLVLLDIMLPELNGIEVLRRMRSMMNSTAQNIQNMRGSVGGKNISVCPIILLTARDSITDKVSGLDSGADDYITKPFAIEELLARIRVALRKKPAYHHAEDATNFSVEGLRLDLNRHTAEYDGNPIELTKREFDLLKTLMENKEVVLTREVLLNTVWGYDYIGETNVVDVYIGYLRNKIDDCFGVKFIHTVRGVGYVVREPSES